MKKINKTQPTQDFIDFVKKKKPTDWRDCDANVRNNARDHMLLQEQYLLCGYTEIYIDNEDCHIDHYVKRSLDNSKCYDWNNLIVAVNDEDFGAKYKDNGRNNIKSLVEYNNILNPIIDNGEDYFEYSLDGKIDSISSLTGNNLIKADKTIEVFNLNHNSLKTRRNDISKLIIDLRKGQMDDEDIKLALEKSGFYSFTNYVLENY